MMGRRRPWELVEPRPITSSHSLVIYQGSYSLLRIGSYGHQIVWRPYDRLIPSVAVATLHQDNHQHNTLGMRIHSGGIGIGVWKCDMEVLLYLTNEPEKQSSDVTSSIV